MHRFKSKDLEKVYEFAKKSSLTLVRILSIQREGIKSMQIALDISPLGTDAGLLPTMSKLAMKNGKNQ